MAITRTAKGTASVFFEEGADDTISLASVAIEGTVVVELISELAFLGASTVEWNGLALTLEAISTNGSGITTEVWSRHGCSGTGTVVATMVNAANGLIGMGVLELAAGVTIETDKTATATGSGTSPSSGATATTAVANEMLVGAIGMNTGAGVGGSWSGSFSSGQDITDSNGISLSDGFRSVAATGTYSAAKTGTTSGQWSAVIVTFKESGGAPQTSNPDVVSGVGSVLAVTVLVGLATISGAGSVLPTSTIIGLADSVSGVGGVSAVNTTVFVPDTVSGVGSVVEPESAAIVPDSYDPELVTSQSFSAIRPTTPAALGDQDASTEVSYRQATPEATGVAEVKATVMSDVPPEQQFPAIAHVVFHALAYIVDIGPYARAFVGNPITWPGYPAHPNTRMAWKVGVDEAQSPLINDDPAIGTGLVSDGIGGFMPGTGFVLTHDADGFDPGDGVSTEATLHTADIATQPNGSPWTWAALNSLTDVCVRWSWAGASPAFDFADLDVSEMWVEVFGPQGSVPEVITLRQAIGKPSRNIITIKASH